MGASALSGSGNFSSATPEWKDVISVRWSTLTYFVLIFSFVIIWGFLLFPPFQVFIPMSSLRLPTTAICSGVSSVQAHLQPFHWLPVHMLSTMKAKRVTFSPAFFSELSDKFMCSNISFACPVFRSFALCNTYTLLIGCKVGKYYYISIIDDGLKPLVKITIEAKVGNWSRFFQDTVYLFLINLFSSKRLPVSDPAMLTITSQTTCITQIVNMQSK